MKLKQTFPSCWTNLIITTLEFGVLLLKDHPEGSQGHENPMTHIPKHDGEQEGERNYSVHRCKVGDRYLDTPEEYLKMVLFHFRRVSWWSTWVDFAVAGYSVGINNVLEASCERVEGKQSWRWSRSGQAVVEGVNPAAALPLGTQSKRGRVGKRKTWLLMCASH